MAHHLLVHSNLPRDHSYANKLTTDEMQSTSVAWASTSAFLSELMQRHINMVENQLSAELLDKISLLEKKLKLAEEEKGERPKRL